MKRPRDLIDSIEEDCEKIGAIKEVGPDYYTNFVQIPDDAMREIIRLIIHDRADDINRMVKGEKRKYTEDDLLRFIRNILSQMSIGRIGFNGEGKVCLYKRVGPEPTPDMQDRLDARVANAAALIRPVFMQVIEESKS